MVPAFLRIHGVTNGVVGYDFFPTYCEWAGVPTSKLPAGIEGGSIAGLLATGTGKVKRSREEMVFHFPHYQSVDGPHSALILGDHKLMKFYEDDRLALFDVAKDVAEQNDLSARMPEKAAELDALLVRYLKDVDAQMAIPNPQYDPNRTATSRKRGGGGGSNRTDAVLQLLDTNGDGTLSPSERKNTPAALRAKDANGDGVVTRDEIRTSQR